EPAREGRAHLPRREPPALIPAGDRGPREPGAAAALGWTRPARRDARPTAGRRHAGLPNRLARARVGSSRGRRRPGRQRIAVGTAAGVIVGIDDDDAWTFRVARRVARRVAKPTATDAPGILFLEIDGLALPVLRRAIRDGTTPVMASWLADGSHLVEWETDLS